MEDLAPGLVTSVRLIDLFETEEGMLVVSADAELREPPDEPDDGIVLAAMLNSGIVVDFTDKRNQLRQDLDTPDKVRAQIGQEVPEKTLPVVGIARNYRECHVIGQELRALRSSPVVQADLRRVATPVTVGFAASRY